MTKPLAIAIMGPTAAGKTDLAIALHKTLGAQIISVDSAMVYRGMDIGTAKPSAEELARAPHRLIDIRDPADAYSVADFVADAQREVEVVSQRGQTPLLAGGTMLYFKALLEGLSPMPPADPVIRADIEAQAARLGWPELHARLSEVDPQTAARLHPNHSQRISRALEVFYTSGRALSDWQGRPEGGLLPHYNWVLIALAPQSRSVLHQRIEKRFDQMLATGFLDEVHGLVQRGDLHSDLPSMRAVGYRQVWQHIVGEVDYETMRANGVAATRQLAKRQLTWLRSWHGLSWINTLNQQGHPRDSSNIFNEALKILEETTI